MPCVVATRFLALSSTKSEAGVALKTFSPTYPFTILATSKMHPIALAVLKSSSMASANFSESLLILLNASSSLPDRSL